MVKAGYPSLLGRGPLDLFSPATFSITHRWGMPSSILAIFFANICSINALTCGDHGSRAA